MMMMVKKTVQKTIYKKLFTKTKKKIFLFIPPHLPPPHFVQILLPEMEIKKKLRTIIQLLTRSTFWNLLTDLSHNMH